MEDEIKKLMAAVEAEFYAEGMVTPKFKVYTKAGNAITFDLEALLQHRLDVGGWVNRMISILWPFRKGMLMSVFISEAWTLDPKWAAEHKDELTDEFGRIKKISAMVDKRVEALMLMFECEDKSGFVRGWLINRDDEANPKLVPLPDMFNGTDGMAGRCTGLFSDQMPDIYSKSELDKHIVKFEDKLTDDNLTKTGALITIADLTKDNMADVTAYMVKNMLRQA